MKRKHLLLTLLLAVLVPWAAMGQTVIYSENFDSYSLLGNNNVVLPTGWTSSTVGSTGSIATIMENFTGYVHAYSGPIAAFMKQIS